MQLSATSAKCLSAPHYIMNARMMIPAKTSTDILLLTRNKLTLLRSYSTFPVGTSEGQWHSVTKVKDSKAKDSLHLPPPKLRLCPLCAPKLDDNSLCSTTHLKKVYHDSHHKRSKIGSLEGDCETSLIRNRIGSIPKRHKER